MSVFSKIETMEDLFKSLLEDSYDSEHRLAEALGKMAEAAHNPLLASAFTNHKGETERQITKLERVFEVLGFDKKRNPCEATKGLVKEGEEIIKEVKNKEVRDAGLIAAGQKAEHYEIASYGTLCALAKNLGFAEAGKLLHEILEEEKGADEKLTKLAEGGINDRAKAA
ncbi:MAG: YciE/YciF ferroxidase family protein [Alphaproteobacteria bacterium]